MTQANSTTTRKRKHLAQASPHLNGDSGNMTEEQLAANARQQLIWHRGEPDHDTDDDYVRHLQRVSLTTDQVKAKRPPPQLLGGYLFQNTTARIYGPPGSSKTFLVVDWALTIAATEDTGWWHDGPHPVVGGPVVYVVAEGASGLGKRIAAYEDRYEVSRYHHQIVWVEEAVNLFDKAQAEGFARYIADVEPILVIFDTLARCTLGADENSTKDAGVVIDSMELIKRTTSACVLTIHHTGYDTSHGRGSTAYLGALDTELSIQDKGGQLTLENPKQKDARRAVPLHLRRVDHLASCVVTAGALEEAGVDEPRPEIVRDVLDYLSVYDGSSQRRVEEGVGHNSQEVRSCLRWMAEVGQDLISIEPKGRSHLHWLTDTGREARA